MYPKSKLYLLATCGIMQRLLNRWYTTNNIIGETRVVREYELSSNVLKINLTFVNHCRYSKILIFELPLEKKPPNLPSYARTRTIAMQTVWSNLDKE